jgi:hypothetical protein
LISFHNHNKFVPEDFLHITSSTTLHVRTHGVKEVENKRREIIQDQEQQQQQAGTTIHRPVLRAIERLADPRHSKERDFGLAKNGEMDRGSLEYLVHFLDNHRDNFHEVLRGFFSRSDTTLTKVTLNGCDFWRFAKSLAALSSLSHKTKPSRT